MKNLSDLKIAVKVDDAKLMDAYYRIQNLLKIYKSIRNKKKKSR